MNRNFKKGNFLPEGRTSNFSIAQEGVLVNWLMFPDSAFFNVGGVLEVCGGVNHGLLEEAINRVVQQNDSLRLSISRRDNYAVQYLVDKTRVSVPLIEFNEEYNGDIWEFLEEEFKKPLEIIDGEILWSFQLIRENNSKHYWLMKYHHLILDASASTLIIGDVASNYNALLEGRELEITRPSFLSQISRDFEYIASARFERDKLFWAGKVADFPAPIYFKRGLNFPLKVSNVEWVLDGSLLESVKSIVEAHGCTLRNFYTAIIAVYLSSICSKNEFIFGIPIHNRTTFEEKNTVGQFATVFPYHLRMQGKFSLLEFIDNIADDLRQYYKHRRFPISGINRLVWKKQPERSQVVDALLSLDTFDLQSNLGGAPGYIRQFSNGLEQAPLAVLISSHAGLNGTVFSLKYTADFGNRFIHEARDHIEFLIKSFVRNPNVVIDDLSLLQGVQRRLVLEEWNERSCDLVSNLTSQLFEEQVALRPDAVAVVFEEREVSYGELNAMANRIAHYLRALGVRPDDRVAICVERGVDMVAGLLGILKAGGAYVPLDPGYPSERLAYMLEDSAPVALLTQASVRDLLSPVRTGHVLVLDSVEGRQTLAHQAVANPAAHEVGLRLEHLAYVIYTSGSTGLPKGAASNQAGLTNRLVWGREIFGATSVTALKTNIGFLDSVTEALATLLAGGRLVVFGTYDVKDVGRFAEKNRSHGVTTIVVVPSLLRYLLDTEANRHDSPLRTIVCSGERLESALITRCIEQYPHVRLFNFYGSSEINGDVTVAEWSQSKLPVSQNSVIGRPVDNMQAYILNDALQPVLPGLTGELYIGGVQLARGYLNRPGLTAERFIANPFGKAGGERLYKTGDLARYLPDGNIEYLGRNDFQVKIRGFRIELGEIEARLAACEGVREAVVLAREDVPGDKRLVAYVVPQSGHEMSAGTLRAALSASLAEYMVPSAFVAMDALPLTPNGKLDRKALPAPDQSSLATREYEAPQGEIECAIAAIWQALLGIERVGRHDHFFELGGHSLLAMQFVAQLRQRLQVELALSRLFMHPVLAQLAHSVAEADVASAPAIVALDRTTRLPLSFPQQRLWFLAQFNSEASLAYHIPAVLRLEGELDEAALRGALDRIVARHENLRTRFVAVEGQPELVIDAADTGFALSCFDLSALEAARQELEVARHAREEASAHFDLSCGPLIRGRLLCLGERAHVLLVTQHHIVSDGWSNGVLVRELSALYGAFCQGQPDPLVPLALQYADYAAWQRGWLEGERLQRQLAFWRGHLSGAPELLDLPLDRPRPALQSYRGAAVDITVPPELTASLKSFGTRHGTTLFMTLLAGWSVLLSRLSGQDDVVIGTPVANRIRAELEPMIGFFANTLALRVRLEGAPTVAQLLAQVKADLLQAYSNQDVPFEQVVEAARPQRSLDHNPLFQTMLSLNNTPTGGALELPGLRLSPVATEVRTTQFDLSLSLFEAGDRIVGTLTYGSDLFDAATIGRMAGYWLTLLEAMCRDADQPVNRIELLSPAQRLALVEGFNDTAVDYGPVRLIHELFEEQVALRPDAVAVVFEEREVSYGDLNAMANRIAHYLRALGVRPDDRVAICVERGVDMMAGLLGILKAGAAYVPLDPVYPTERLAYMLADSAPVALLTQGTLQAPACAVPVVALDDGSGLLAGQPTENPDPQALGLHSRNLAYVIYTSGSSGNPKGVCVEHKSVSNLWQGLRDTVLAQAPANYNVGLNASYAFDASLKGILQLLSGHCLHLIPQQLRSNGADLIEFIRQQQIDVIDCTPTQLNMLLAAGFAELGHYAPRIVLIGGESIPAAMWERLQRSSATQFFNVYGPTECTVDATTFPITGSRCGPTIGRAIQNTQIYILDRNGGVVPLGVAGELYIGGVQLARGYLNRPGLTAERFIANPFGKAGGERLYKTGDLARYLPDGNIEYLGRNDFQVKIRGFRIELGEIEARLAACEGVREAVVLAREDAPGDKRLVAYVVPRPGHEMSAGTLRAALSASLAEYMVPSAFVAMDALPLTPNGKLDRKALPAPDQSSLATREYEAPQGEIECAIAAIWQALLGIERVGRHDHFFELGGHSLLAMQFVAQLRQRLQVELALSRLFMHPVLAQLAHSVAEADVASAPAIVALDRTTRLPLSFPQQRLWFLAQFNSEASLAYHVPAVLRLEGELDEAALRGALDRIVARHENLRTRFVAVEGQPELVIDAADTGFALSRFDLSALEAARQELEVARHAREEASAPFDLSCGPLIRGRLLCLGERAHVLLVTQHHIVSDGWSNGVLVRELSALYGAFCQGQPDPLVPLALQYADYAAWQRGWLEGERLQRQLAFWRGHLSGAPELLDLPLDRPRPALQSYRGAAVDITVPPELTASLKSFGTRHGTTLFMTLLAGWSVLLSRLSGQDDVVIGTPVANRIRAELEPMIGFFANTLALRVRLEGAPTVAQLLAQVKADLLQAYSNQDVPFEQVVEAVRPQRSLDHNPLFQTMLSLNNTPTGGALELPGLRLSPVATEVRKTQFDLVLSLVEAGDRIVGTLTYGSDLFDAATIGRMAGYWLTLLEAMCRDADQPVNRIELLSPAQRLALVEGFNDTAVDYGPVRLIHELFEEQVALRPDAVAVVFEEREVSYGDLNAMANRIAHYLRALGVRPDDRVAICVERGVDMVAGLLGILKAGGAYVPLDPGYPSERLAYMLEDSAPVALLTQASVRDLLSPVRTGHVLVLDSVEGRQTLAHQAVANPAAHEVGLRLEHLAYVIYTSGSTGLPKGAASNQAGLTNRLVWGREIFGATSVTALKTNIGFLDSVTEALATLLAGGRLVVFGTYDVKDVGRFAEKNRSHGVTTIVVVPSLLRYLLDTEANRHDSPLRTIVCSGERLESALITRCIEQYPHVRLFNFYGSSEINGDVTVAEWSQSKLPVSQNSVIGRPVDNMQAYILNDALQPVLPGLTGELYIGGVQLARGYLNRPGLTAERFIANPFGKAGGERLYKTGDLARYLPDGNIEYLGRNDFQVKIRGFRIELGEIEARLAACEGVREAVVLAREDVPGDKRLVAYVVPQSGHEMSAGTLRAALSASLAEYMVPSAFVAMDALPLTPNGKLDRKTLPAPDQSSLATREYEAPQGEIECAIAAIWQALLGIERVGRHDHFFELGGHSLLAMQFVAQLRQRLQVELALSRLFMHPVLAQLAHSVAEADVASAPAIVALDRTTRLPLSFPQQRLWFLAQFNSEASLAYHIPAVLRLEGELDEAALRGALDRIVARHENLRTRFVAVEGQPELVIDAADTGFALSCFDLSALEAARQELEVARHAREEASAHFDLSCGPLIRGRLLCLGERAHVLLVTQHHIVSDGWSNGVLVRELSALYGAFCQGQPDPLVPLALQYADYAAWQRGWLEGERLQRQLAFWRGHLSGAPELLDLPLDRPRPALQSYRGAAVDITVPPELTASLKSFGTRHGTTLFMTLLAGWSVLLSRLSGQDDVVIGTPVANRIRAELEPMIGFFANTLALRVRLEGAPTVAQLLAQVKADLLQAYSNQDVPFEQVVEAARPQRSLDHNPLFQTMLSLNNTPTGGALELPGLRLSPVATEVRTTQFDLSLSLFEAGDRIVGTLTYGSDLFDAATIGRMAGYWLTLLEAMCRDADQPVNRIELLSPAQRLALVEGFNDTAVDYGPVRLIHELFEEQVALRPDAVAVVFEEREVSYGDLNAMANRIAHYLRALGVRPDDRVAICVERGVDMVAGLLGILKAGAAYVPLDPGYPSERLAYMLEDSAPVALLTQASVRERLFPVRTGHVLVLDSVEGRQTLAHQAVVNPAAHEVGLHPEHLAYVIYTSGSTGLPKGAANNQVGLTNRLVWGREILGATSVTALKTNIGFIDSVTEALATLLIGGRLVVFGGHDVKDVECFAEKIRSHGVTTIVVVPSLLRYFLDTEANRHDSPLRTIVCSGERLESALITRCIEQYPHVRLFNFYGSSEINGDVTVAEWSQSKLPVSQNSVIGRPVDNMQAYILNDALQPVLPGLTGELYIGGVQLARGYLNRPGLTAERFIANPFGKAGGERLYKTGDLVRYLPGGNIEYLGRNDFQVKIRGFRIELGEIEARLAACEGVREAVVLAREDVPGDKRLVAYVVPQSGHEMSAGTLRAALSASLAEYMVPSAFVAMDALPLTPNGKLDRKALPAPDQSSLATREYEAPQGEIECAIAAIWQALLGIERVGRHDHFFELGGHSLLAMQFVAQLRQRLQVELALSRLFMHPVLAQLAHSVAEADVASAPAIVALDRTTRLPLSFPQQRLWFLAQFNSEASLAYHIPAVLRLEGELDEAALRGALDRIVARHENLRTRFVAVEGQPELVIDAADTGFALSCFDLSALEAARQELEVARHAREEASAHFDLSCGPLIRGRLLCLGERAHVLLVTQHHIVSDGWSNGVLVRELSALYGAFCQGQPDPLVPLALQYADYAAWQRGWLEGERLQRQLAFWRGHLSGAPELLDLPLDRPRPALQSYRGAAVDITVPPELTASLKSFGTRHGTTLFMTLLAGWSVLLSRLSGQDDVVIGTPVANRIRAELEPMIGFFANTLALRVRLEGAPTVAQLLAQVKADLLQAYSNQDVPFEQVVEAARPQRSLDHNPLFQTMLSLNNTPTGGALELPGLRLSPVATEVRTTQFDLSLSLFEAGDRIVGTLTYGSDLFDAATIGRMAGYWLTLLEAMCRDADQPVNRIELLSPAQRLALVEGFNDTAVDYGPVRLIHELFEEQVALRPDAVAVVFEEREVSYGDLNAMANRIAHYLRALGVRPDDRVAICVERGVDMVAGLLGILKAGAAYVPLDPGYPSERLAYMLEDSAPVALLTQASVRERLFPVRTGHVLVLDSVEGRQTLAHQAVVNPAAHEVGLHPEHLAYVIYTSGSTGLPKGVAIGHASIINLAKINSYAPVEVTDCIAHCASPAFDATTWEIWSALLNGAPLLVVSQNALLEPSSFIALLKRHSVTMMWMTSGLFNEYARELVPVYAQLKYLIVGGDKVDPSTVQFVLNQVAPPRHLLNGYGPTETTTFATTYDIDGARTRTTMPIGRPIGNVSIYLLDEELNPVPLGVAGELYIGGVQLARGYLNRPGLTAERFIANPFGKAGGERLYKTGDLARYLPDGNIEYLGRNDFQVKIRGFRIELGEIEARLAACEGVREAVVLAREDAPGDKRLVAYVVPQPGHEMSAGTLRAALSASLAEYMVPSAFVAMDALPLTPNGKLDRKALPAPDQSSLATREYEAPQGEIECAIAAIWQALLGIERVGRHDHFFELGGHSLLVIQFIEQLRTRDIGADVRSVFQYPALAQLAAEIARHSASVFVVPPNLIPAGCERITPAMLPLVALTQEQIDRIAADGDSGMQGIQDIYPLAPLQKGILFHHLLQTQGDVYLLRSVFAFDGRAQLDRFIQALQRVIDRHDILRSGVQWEGLDEPVQVVYRQAVLPAETLSLSPGRDALPQLLEHTDPRHRRLDLRRAPLLGAYVAPDAQSGRWLLSLLSHHVISDHITLELVSAEIGQLLLRDDAVLPAPVPYRNFVAQTLSIPDSVHAQYFTACLGDIDAPTVPFGVAGVHGMGDVRSAHMALDSALAGAVRKVARHHGVTPATLFHLAWAQVLGQCSGREDVVFGIVLSGRLQGTREADRVLGMFINTLPLRLRLQGKTVEQGLRETHSAIADLLAHEQASLALAQRCSGVGPDMPLFTALFNYRHSHAAPETAEVQAAWNGIEMLAAEETTNYPVTVSVDDLGTGFGLTAQCVPGIDAQRLVGYVHTAMASLVDALTTQPARLVRSLAILPEQERRELVEGFNDTAMDYDPVRPIHELFEEQVALRPDAVAVVFEEREVSYGDLNAMANRIAHYLRALGVRPDDRVAICVERGVDMVAGLLGILKAGAAYVPLDPGYPSERLAYMLKDSAPVALLTQASLRDLLSPVRTGHVLILDSEEGRQTLARQAVANLAAHEAGLRPQHLAYVIYTSGSTGLPKGAMVAHGSLINRLHWAKVQFSVDCRERVLQKTPIGFDVSVWELFLPLMTGAAMILPGHDEHKEPARLIALIERWKVTALHFVPSMLQAFMPLMPAHPCPTVRHVFCSGEALPYSLMTQLRDYWRHAQVHNLYGPTEATVEVSHWLADENASGVVPIGKPVANTQLHIFDEELNPVPLGVAGELYIGGVQLARGYLNRPGLTAERFIANPFGKAGGERLYKTGDLVRYLPDGNIEYLGRNDFQVKIRGFRIELGEIEARLAACEGVREAVVLAREDAPGDKRLVAYVVPRPGHEMSAGALRATLSASLAEYMVPSAFVAMDALPLTPNGKLDRQALPAPQQRELTVQPGRAKALTITEIVLLEIWSDILSQQNIDLHESFFELGGNSLLAVKCYTRIKAAFDVDLPIRAILFGENIASAALLVDILVGLKSTKSESERMEYLEKLTEEQAEKLLYVYGD